MDDSWPPFRAAGEGGAASDQRVDQGVIPMARRRMNHQTGGLVDDGEILVLEHERERDGGGLERTRRFVIRHPDDDDFAAGEEAGSASDLAIDRHSLVGHQAGSLGAGDGHLIGEKAVEALGLEAKDGEFDRGATRVRRAVCGCRLLRLPASHPPRGHPPVLHLRRPESTPPPTGGRPPATARWRVR